MQTLFSYWKKVDWKKIDSILDWAGMSLFACLVGMVVGMNYGLAVGMLSGAGFFLLCMVLVQALKKLIAHSRRTSVKQRVISGAKE